MKLITIYENRIYSVKNGCSVKLIDVSQNNAENIVLTEGKQFRVEHYSGEDIYGEDYVIYNGSRFLFCWDKKILECLIELCKADLISI